MAGIEHLANFLIRRVAQRRPPDFVIGSPKAPYLRRWWVIPRNRFFNVYLHHFLRSDDDRALHDHPWINASILLRGAYYEHLQDGRRVLRREGAVYLRRPSTAHRVELLKGYRLRGIDLPPAEYEHPCWTLFITGPRVRAWGFLCPKGWVPWQQFTAARDGKAGEIGQGCADG